MAFTKNNNDSYRQYTEIKSFSVSRVHVWDNGGVTLNIEMNGIQIYGVRIMTTNGGDQFLSMPSRKGSDGKYYPIVGVYLQKSDQESIIKEAERVWNENNSK